jgi:hypothetical protein
MSPLALSRFDDGIAGQLGTGADTALLVIFHGSLSRLVLSIRVKRTDIR